MKTTILALACMLSACATTQTTTTGAATHRLTLTWPKRCADDRADVTVAVDGAAYRFPAGRDHPTMTITDGPHLIVQYHGSYEVWRWKIEPERDSFIGLRCFSE